MSTQQFNFFKSREAEQFSFYRIPKILFTDKRFSEVSVEAKVLYGLLLDRMSLSIKNGWIDEEDRVYIYFKLEDAMEFMGIGKDKGVRLFAELDTERGCGLIHKVRQGLGKPIIIYVMNFNYETEENPENTQTSVEEKETEVQTSEKPKSRVRHKSEVQTSEKPKSRLRHSTEVKTSENPTSRLLEYRSQDFGKSDSNDTEFSNNKYINTESIYHSSSAEPEDDMSERVQYRKLICRSLDFDVLLTMYDEDIVSGIVDMMVDCVCSKKKTITIGGEEISQQIVKSIFLKLDRTHIEYVIDSLHKNTSKVRNIRAYLLTMLYNSHATLGAYYTAEVNHDLYGREGEV